MKCIACDETMAATHCVECGKGRELWEEKKRRQRTAKTCSATCTHARQLRQGRARKLRESCLDIVPAARGEHEGQLLCLKCQRRLSSAEKTYRQRRARELDQLSDTIAKAVEAQAAFTDINALVRSRPPAGSRWWWR